MLRQRLITAFILIPLTLFCLVYLPSGSFALLTGMIALYGAWEWTALMGVKTISARFIYLALMTFIFVLLIFIPPTIYLVVAFVWWLIATLLVVLYPRASGWFRTTIFWRGLMGIVVLAPCWGALNFIRNQEVGIYALLYLFALIWGADSAAYFAGKKWGKHKLLAEVSPGKSWEGLGGALLFSIPLALIALGLCKTPLYVWPWAVALSLLIVFSSVVGDLFESMIKRQAGVKDSGMLLPGHGGLLDRIDSLTAAAPIFALGAMMLGQYLS